MVIGSIVMTASYAFMFYDPIITYIWRSVNISYSTCMVNAFFLDDLEVIDTQIKAAPC